MTDDPSVDPTPPVRKFAAHHLVMGLALLGLVFGALFGYCVDGAPR
jgi:hypothetical protein